MIAEGGTRSVHSKGLLGESEMKNMGGIEMDALSGIIASNLRKIRREKKLSLDNVADMTGVSKSMLGQIERGESSPTVATLFKIASGLHTSLTGLLEDEERPTKVINKEDLNPLFSNHGHFRLYPFFPYDDDKRFEIFVVELDTGSMSESLPREDGVETYMMVFEGCIQLRIMDKKFVLQEGCAMRFDADQPHMYKNIGEGTAKVCQLMYYKK